MNRDWDALINHAQKCNAIITVDQPDTPMNCIFKSFVFTPPLKYALSDITPTHFIQASTNQSSSVPKNHQSSIRSNAGPGKRAKNPQSKQQSNLDAIPEKMAGKHVSSEIASDKKTHQSGNTGRAFQKNVRSVSISSLDVLHNRNGTKRATEPKIESGIVKRKNSERSIKEILPTDPRRQKLQTSEHPVLDSPSDTTIKSNITRCNTNSKEKDYKHNKVGLPESATLMHNDSHSHATPHIGQNRTRIARTPSIDQRRDTQEKLKRLNTHDKSHKSSVPKCSEIRDKLFKSVKHTK